MENERFVVLKDGKPKFELPGKLLADGTVRLLSGGKWLPVTNGEACRAAGLDPKTVAASASPSECLAHMGDNGNGLVVLTAAENIARVERETAERRARIEAAVPGITEAIRLSDAASHERERAHSAFERMMEDENNDGACAPRPEDRSIAARLAEHLAAHPRAAVYLEAKHQSDYTHWADNTGKGAAGHEAMTILAAGGSIEDAKIAMAQRRKFVD